MHIEERVRWKAITATNKLSHRLSTLPVADFSASSNVKCLDAPPFSSSAFEEDIVGDYDSGAAVLLQNSKDVLEEVEL